MSRASFALPCGSVGASLLANGAHARSGWFGWSQTAAVSPALNMARPNNGLLALGWEFRANRRAGRCIGFALLGDSLFSNARMAGPSKVSKNACPCIRPRLRRGSLAPMMFQGPAAKGHPCPIAALAASMPPTPLHITCARPPERGVRRHLIVRLSRNRQSVFVSLFANLQTPRTQSPFSNVGWKTAQHFPALTTAELLPNHADSIRPINRGGRRRLIGHLSANKRSAFVSLFTIFQAARSRLPFRRPSVVAVEGVERHGCRESCDGSGPPSVGMALRSVPLERRWSEGTLRAAKGRMQGSPSLWLLSLGETRESDAPCEAQPVGGAKESAAPHRSTQATANTQCIRKRQTNSPYEFHPLPTRAAARPFASPPRQPHCPQRRHP